MREIAVYVFIALSSLVMVSYIPHMFLTGYVEPELVTKVQFGITGLWAIGLVILGVDIVKKRKGLK